MPLVVTWICGFCSCIKLRKEIRVITLEWFLTMLQARDIPTGFSGILAISQFWQELQARPGASLPKGQSNVFSRSPDLLQPGQIFFFPCSRVRIRPACRRCIPRKPHSYVDSWFFLSCCTSHCGRNDIAHKFDRALQGHPPDCLTLLTQKFCCCCFFFLTGITSLLTFQRLQQASLLLTTTKHNFTSPQHDFTRIHSHLPDCGITPSLLSQAQKTSFKYCHTFKKQLLTVQRTTQRK